MSGLGINVEYWRLLFVFDPLFGVPPIKDLPIAGDLGTSWPRGF